MTSSSNTHTTASDTTLNTLTLYQPIDSTEIEEINLNHEIIDLTNTRLLGIPPIIQQCYNVHTLVLRQNQISAIKYLNQLPQLHTIDLYLNNISDLTITA